MAAEKLTQDADLTSLVRIMEECPYPIVRLNAEGKVLYSNSAVHRQQHK